MSAMASDSDWFSRMEICYLVLRFEVLMCTVYQFNSWVLIQWEKCKQNTMQIFTVRLDTTHRRITMSSLHNVLKGFKTRQELKQSSCRLDVQKVYEQKMLVNDCRSRSLHSVSLPKLADDICYRCVFSRPNKPICCESCLGSSLLARWVINDSRALWLSRFWSDFLPCPRLFCNSKRIYGLSQNSSTLPYGGRGCRVEKSDEQSLHSSSIIPSLMKKFASFYSVRWAKQCFYETLPNKH